MNGTPRWMRALLCLVVPLGVALAACESAATPPAKPTPTPAPAEPAPAGTRPAEPAPPNAPAAWPYVAWDRAEAITFNQFEARRGVPLRVVDAKGWSPHVAARKPLTPAQAQHALELFAATEGELEVSKCPFPRHAVVLYAGEEPVASINVCFACGDILGWPASAAPTLDVDTRLTRHEATMPRWEAFFRDELGLPLGDWD